MKCEFRQHIDAVRLFAIYAPRRKPAPSSSRHINYFHAIEPALCGRQLQLAFPCAHHHRGDQIVDQVAGRAGNLPINQSPDRTRTKPMSGTVGTAFSAANR
jgi:hypothetical protein